MALNIVREECLQVSVPVPDGTESGDIVFVGDLPAVALVDQGAWTEGEATVKFDGSVELEVDVTVAVGDVIYDHSGTFNKTASGGTRVGVAIGSKGSGNGTVEVKLSK